MKKEEQNNISNTLSAIFLFAGQTLRSVTAWFVLCLFLVLTLTYVRLFTDYPSNKNWPELYGIVSNLLSGTVVSFLFYYLVVVVPESRKRNILRTNLARTYKILKEDILWQIVFASQKGGRTDLDTTSEFVRKLLDVAEFKKAFADG